MSPAMLRRTCSRNSSTRASTMPWSYLSYWYMADHPVAGRGIGGFQCQVGAHGRAERADAVLDMRGTRAFGGRLGIDDIAAVGPPRAVLGRQHRLAMFADVDGVLDVERPNPEERRAGKEWVSPCRSRWSPYP